MANQKTYQKDKLSNWILIMAFILSVFSYSGYVPQNPKLQKPPQTEFVSKYKTKKTARTLCFSKTFALMAVCKPPPSEGILWISICGHEIHFLYAFNRLTKTQFDLQSRRSMFIKDKITSFLIDKTPECADEGAALSI